MAASADRPVPALRGADLTETLGRATRDGEALGALLSEESTLLAARRLAEWEALLPRKHALVESLDRAAEDLRATLPDDAARADVVLGEQLARVRTAIAACRQRNLANGRLVERLARHTRRALGILTGAPESPATYGRDGTAVRRGASRYAGSA